MEKRRLVVVALRVDQEEEQREEEEEETLSEHGGRGLRRICDLAHARNRSDQVISMDGVGKEEEWLCSKVLMSLCHAAQVRGPRASPWVPFGAFVPKRPV